MKKTFTNSLIESINNNFIFILRFICIIYNHILNKNKFLFSNIE